jgi:hypothetical protein
MATFWVTTICNKAGGRPLQFAFETNEANDLAEFRDRLESGAHILGRRSVFVPKVEWEDMILTGAFVIHAQVYKDRIDR